jgi:hypothetical protein
MKWEVGSGNGLDGEKRWECWWETSRRTANEMGVGRLWGCEVNWGGSDLITMVLVGPSPPPSPAFWNRKFWQPLFKSSVPYFLWCRKNSQSFRLWGCEKEAFWADVLHCPEPRNVALSETKVQRFHYALCFILTAWKELLSLFLSHIQPRH